MDEEGEKVLIEMRNSPSSPRHLRHLRMWNLFPQTEEELDVRPARGVTLILIRPPDSLGIPL